MGSLIKVFGFIVKPFKYLANLVGEGAAKVVQTFMFYIAFGGTIYILGQMRILPREALGASVLICSLVLSFVTVIRTRVSVSESDVRYFKTKSELDEVSRKALDLERNINFQKEQYEEKYTRKVSELEKQIDDQKNIYKEEITKEKVRNEKLVQDMKNQRSQLLNMDWIWEINLAQIKLQRIKMFDYFVRPNQEPIPWTERPKNFMENDKRAIGALKIDYTAKIGIDLKDVLVRFDRDSNKVCYWIPEPYQTGALDPSDDWAIKCAMNYTTGKGMMDLSLDWRWHDEESLHSALPIWEVEKTNRYRDAFASQELKDQLGVAVKNEAEGRVKAFFEKLLGCKAELVTKDQIDQSDNLGIMLPLLMKNDLPALK